MSKELPPRPHAAAPVAVADEVDTEPARGEAPNNQLPLLLFIVELLATGIRPGAVSVEFLPSTDMVHENAGSGFQDCRDVIRDAGLFCESSDLLKLGFIVFTTAACKNVLAHKEPVGLRYRAVLVFA